MTNIILDLVAIAIVIVCAVYAIRALLPPGALARITGKHTVSRKSCGACDGCGEKQKSDDGCH